MHIDPKIFKSYDIRGIYPDQLNEQNIVPVTRAILKVIQNQTQQEEITIAVGRDMRLSSPTLFEKVVETLLECGVQVIDLGLTSTPTIYFAVSRYGYTGGIQVSASHNPKEYNGLKIVRNSSSGLIKIGKSTGMDQIKQYAFDNVNFSSKQKGERITKDNVLNEEVKNAFKIAGNPKIKPFKIVCDAANSMGSLYVEALFNQIPGDLIKMNFELDGSFPAHQPDPLQSENLRDLQQKVLEEKADLGIEPDGDGDRMFFIDDRGDIVPPSIITSIIAADFLKRHKGEKILVDIRYLLNAKKIIEKFGGQLNVSKVGHAFITEHLHKSKAIFAGESSAHYFYRETGNAESQLTTLLIILKILSQSNKKLSELTKEYMGAFESGEINFKVENAPEILEALKQAYGHGQVSELDGLAIDFPDWRLSLRSSNTEPLLRLNVEHYNKDELKPQTEEIIETIKKHAKMSADQSAHH